MQIAKWGNSLAMRLPASVVKVLNLKEGDHVELHATDWRELDVARKPAPQDLLERLRSF